MIRGVALLSVLAAPAGGQSLLYEFDGADVPLYPTSVAMFGDVDLDGCDDFGFSYTDATISGPPTAWIVSGKDGTPLYTRAGTGSAVIVAAAGDADGDGAPDVLFSRLGLDVQVLSGATGTPHLNLLPPGAWTSWGAPLAGVGDTNLDGFDDFVVADPNLNLGIGQVYVHSGLDGALLFSRPGSPALMSYGKAVAAAGDLDVDGHEDVWVGSNGGVEAVSGKDGSLLYLVPATGARDSMGVTVAALDDVDGDAIPDVVIGWPNDDTLAASAGRVDVHSGTDGSLLYTIPGTLPFFGYFGSGVAGVGDLDSDLRGDFAVGELGGDPGGVLLAGRVRFYSGRTGAWLFDHYGNAPNGRLGFRVAGGGDVNGDGQPDAIACTNKGPSFRAISGRPLPLEAADHLVSVSAGGAVVFTLAASPALAGDLYGMLGSTAGPSPGFVLGSAYVPLNPADPYFRFTLKSPGAAPLSTSVGVLDATGGALARFVVPFGSSPSLVGVTAFHAFVVVDAATGGFPLASNSVPVTLVP